MELIITDITECTTLLYQEALGLEKAMMLSSVFITKACVINNFKTTQASLQNL